MVGNRRWGGPFADKEVKGGEVCGEGSVPLAARCLLGAAAARRAFECQALARRHGVVAI